MLEKHRWEGNIAKDKIGMEKIGPRLVPQVLPDVYCLPPRSKKKGTKIKGSKLGRETSPILKDPRLEPRGKDQSTEWKMHIDQQI